MHCTSVKMAQSTSQAPSNTSVNDRITTSSFADSIENQWKQTVVSINQLFRDHECKEIPDSEGELFYSPFSVVIVVSLILIWHSCLEFLYCHD